MKITIFLMNLFSIDELALQGFPAQWLTRNLKCMYAEKLSVIPSGLGKTI